MASNLITALLALQLAALDTPSPPSLPTPHSAPDWSAAPPADKAAIRSAVRALLEQDAQAVNPRRHEADTLRGERYATFAAAFADARVRDCLRADGLKRQSTLIFSGVLALPFVPLAKLRGKCN